MHPKQKVPSKIRNNNFYELLVLSVKLIFFHTRKKRVKYLCFSMQESPISNEKTKIKQMDPGCAEYVRQAGQATRGSLFSPCDEPNTGSEHVNLRFTDVQTLWLCEV